MHLTPSIDCSRNTDWEHAPRWNGTPVQLLELQFHLFVTQPQWRTPAAVETIKLVFFCAVNDGEKIAADSIRNRLHQSKSSIGRDCCVDRATAPFQNVEPNLCRCRHTRAHHSVPRQHFRARRERFAGNPVDLGDRNSGACKYKKRKDCTTERRNHGFTLSPLSFRGNARGSASDQTLDTAYARS